MQTDRNKSIRNVRNDTSVIDVREFTIAFGTVIFYCDAELNGVLGLS